MRLGLASLARGALLVQSAFVAFAAFVAEPVAAGGGDRFVLAWPPTRYESAELVLWLDEPSAAPAQVRVRARGLDVLVDVGAGQATRVPLPAGARCSVGVDACAIEAARVSGESGFSALLQSPDTHGAADTLLLTAHDTVRLRPAAEAGSEWRLLSMPSAPPGEMPLTASFASVVPANGGASVQVVGSSCAGVTQVDLQEGEVLTLSCGAVGEDLSGLAIVANAPIVVLSGNSVTTVPVDPGSGLSGDLLLDLAAEPVGAARYVALPLPRAPALAGRGDVVRIVALEAARITVSDDRGGLRVLDLVPGEVADLDTAAAGGDLALSLSSDASIACWQVPKSRALRGLGDPAAIPLVASTRYTLASRFFVPEGYAEANVLVVAAEPGARVLLDGMPLMLQPAPSGELVAASVVLPVPPAGGALHELTGDAPFGAWLAGFGGYKAHGCVAAEGRPRGPWILRGSHADALVPIAPASGSGFVDPEAGTLLFWQHEDDGVLLTVSRCGDAACLAW